MTNNIPANPTPQALNANSKIGEILIALGFATQQGVDDTFAYQQAERGKGNNPGLIGELFVQRGVCTAEQRDIGMKVQSLLKEAFQKSQELINLDSEARIGKILIAFGHATADAVEATFAWQSAERAAGRDPGLIGELFVQRGVCSAEQRDFGMKIQGLLRR